LSEGLLASASGITRKWVIMPQENLFSRQRETASRAPWQTGAGPIKATENLHWIGTANGAPHTHSYHAGRNKTHFAHILQNINKNEAAQARPPLSIARLLENELRLQFDYSWGCIGTQTRAIDGRRLTDGLRDLSELIAVHVGVGEGKIWMIK